MAEAVGIKYNLNISPQEIARNIQNSLRFPQFQPGGCPGAVAICAAGSSLIDSLPLIKALHDVGIPICAIKGAADVLIDAGIIPTYVVSMDGKADQVRFFSRPCQDAEYLVAGQSHPAVFEALANCRVTVWHGEGKEHLPEGTNYVLGGSTTGTRAISLMWAKGYDVHHLFAFDCCELNGRTHVYTPGKEQRLVDVYLGITKFRVTGQMVYQYKEIVDFFANDRRINIFVHGNGLLAAAWQRINAGQSVSLNAFPSLTIGPSLPELITNITPLAGQAA